MKERFAIWLAPQNGERREVAPLRQLGWAFLLAWVFCVALHQRRRRGAGDAIPDAGEAAASAAPVPTSIGAAPFYAVLPFGRIRGDAGGHRARRARIGSPTSHRPLFVVAPALTAASTPFMFVSVADPGLNAAAGIGAVATGIGSALCGRWASTTPSSPRSIGMARAGFRGFRRRHRASGIRHGRLVPVAAPRRSRFCPASVHLAWTPEAARTEEGSQPPIASQPSGAPLAGLGRTGLAASSSFSIVSIAGMMSAERVEGIPFKPSCCSARS